MDDMRPQSRSQEEARPRERAHRGRKLDPAPLTGGIGVERLVDRLLESTTGRLFRFSCVPSQPLSSLSQVSLAELAGCTLEYGPVSAASRTAEERG